MNIFEILKSVDNHATLDVNVFMQRYFEMYDWFEDPSETLTYFDYDGYYILHKWDTRYGAEYLWTIRDSSGNFHYHSGSVRSNKV